jgi:Ca-activated chloride channel homolog
LELVFPYGSEKEKWINDVTAAFNRSGAKTKSGKTIFVRALPMGSGESDRQYSFWPHAGAS